MAKLRVEREQLPYDPPKIPKPPLCNNFFPIFSLCVSLFYLYNRLYIYIYFKFHLKKGKESVSYFINIFQNSKSYQRGKEVKKIGVLL